MFCYHGGGPCNNQDFTFFFCFFFSGSAVRLMVTVTLVWLVF